MMEETAPPAAVVPGDVLAGKYLVERVLGRGGMGVVVAARHKDLDELFAIKLLLPQAAADPQAIERFLREARAAVRLKGEHVAKVTDVGRLENGSPYIVMEHLSGIDLRRHVRTAGPLPVGEAVTHVLQACDAIAEAHALGIIHRDLKPANLFLTRRANGTSCVKVLDFGISKHMTQEAVDITRTGDVLGTPLYMAPEQMARMKDADARCDVWSMGIVLYELLTGTTPFHGTMITEIVARVLQEDAAPPSRFRPDVPPAIDAIVIRCLQKRAAQRFQTIVELASALRAAGTAGVDTGPRQASFPDLSGSARISMPVAPAETGTLHLSSSSLPTQPFSSAVALPLTPALNTSSAWGTTGPVRATRSSGALRAFAVLGGIAVVLASIGVWVALRSPAEPPPGASTPAVATTGAEPAPPATAPLAAPPAAPDPPAPTATSTTAAPGATPTGTVGASATAPVSGGPVSKPVVRKPAAPPPVADPPRFGGIR